MRQLLAEVVEAGTGISAQIPGYEVGGKTGTANKLGDDGRYSDITMASFVGLAPIDDPKIVVAVVVDGPACEFRTGGMRGRPGFCAGDGAGPAPSRSDPRCQRRVSRWVCSPIWSTPG